jgi:hypothetical protein
MSTLGVSEMLQWHGFEFSGERSHQAETRAWLESELCFHEVEHGRWALGFHAEELGAGRPDPIAEKTSWPTSPKP